MLILLQNTVQNVICLINNKCNLYVIIHYIWFLYIFRAITMDNSEETITEENANIANDNITINEKLIHTAKKHTENIYSEAEWSIVYFEIDIEKEIDDGSHDLIPSS